MKQHTYTRELRLLTPADFQAVFANPPVKAVTAELTMLATPNSLGHARVGVTISKKRAKKAVDRNRIKRKIRETFRLTQHQLPSFDIIVIAKPGITALDATQLQERLDYLWRTIAKRCKQFQLASSASINSESAL